MTAGGTGDPAPVVTGQVATGPVVAAVVLCGGQGRRFGGDKTRAELGGRPVLDLLLDALPPDWPVICVGPERPTSRAVRWSREEPPGGGPVAGLAAALPQVDTSIVVLLGGDMPYAGPAAARLAAALAGLGAAGDQPPPAEALAARDGEGRVQPLLAAYRREALQRALPPRPAGSPLMRLLDGLRVETVLVEAPASLDVDTPADLDDARHRLDP
jgi:molybdopterin-guanine dinucleotide biosynthesis protein A